MSRRRVRVRLTVIAVLAALLVGASGPVTAAAAADVPPGPGSVTTPSGLNSAEEVAAPAAEKPVRTPPEALRDQPASPPTTEPLDPATAADLTSETCTSGTCLRMRPVTAADASQTRTPRNTKASVRAQSTDSRTAAAPTYGPPECAFAPDVHVGYWRYNPNRMMSCRSISTLYYIEQVQNGVREILGTETINVNEWFATAYNSMTLTHGVMFEGVAATEVGRTRGVSLSAPYPCALSVPIGQNGCEVGSTGLAVSIAELPEGIARAFEWTETMVLDDDDETQQRLLFGDFLRVTLTHPAATNTNSLTFDGTDEFRCDTQTNVRGAGCVNSRFVPTVTFDDAEFPELAPVTHHMRLAQDELPEHPGRPGDVPLVRVPGSSSEAEANRNRSCDSNPAFRYDGAGTECDEYPFASTVQSSTSTFSAMPVPGAANSKQGNILSESIYNYRINVDDSYYVVSKANSNRGGSKPGTNPTLNAQFTSYGDNAGCADWSGGDATNSVQIPGTSKRAWFFSDSFLGAPSDRRNLFATSAIRNSIVVQDGSTMRTITGGNTCQESNTNLDFFKRYAKTPAADADGGFFWTGDQVVSGTDVVKFYYHGRPTDVAWVNDYAAVAKLSAANLSTASTMTIEPVKLSCAAGGPDAMWGTMVMKWSDGNYYIYGTGASVPHQLYLARASAANLTDFSGWQFFGGSDLKTATGSGTATWTTCAGAKPLPIGSGATGGSVNYINGTVWLIQDDYVNPSSFSVGTLSAHPSQTPWGFTDRRIPLYDPPEGTHNYPYYHWVYEPRIQNGLTSGSNLVLSYNVNTDARNTGCVDANNWDGHIYRPRFVNIPTSWFNTYDAAYMSTGTYSYPGVTPAREVATNIGGATDWSPGGLGANSCPTVNPASQFSATAKSDGTVDMSWKITGSDVWTYLWQCDSTVTTCGTTPDCTSGAAGFTKQFGGLWLTVQSINLAPIQAAAQNGHTFKWYVCSSGARGGRGGPSAIVTAAVRVPVPSAPANLRLTARSGTSATLAWNEVTFPSKSVFITPYYWDITAGGTAANAIAGTAQAGGTTMTTTVPNATHTYGFYLKASNIAGIGPASNQVQG